MIRETEAYGSAGLRPAAENGAAQQVRPTVIGRFVEIRHAGLLLKATVIDTVAGYTQLPKRVRVQSIGKIQGDVLMPADYEIVQFL